MRNALWLPGGFRVLCAIIILFSVTAMSRAQQGVVAMVNGQEITETDLESAIKNQLAALNEQLSMLRQAGLSKLIDNLLVEQAAKAEGLPVEQYLAKYVERISVSAEEVEQAYAKSKDQLPAVLPPEAKYRIRRSLEDNRRADALRSLLQKLRQEAEVRNLVLEKISSAIDLAPEDGPMLGSRTTPVTIVAFNDFECPFCQKAVPVVQRIIKQWPERVHLVFKHFPLDSHQHARNAAKAAVCAERADRFWEFHERAFAQGQDLSPAGLQAIASSIGLEPGEFNKCMALPETEERVQRDVRLGRAAGVNATPTFFVNNRKVSNAAELETRVRELLSKLQPSGR